MLYIMRHGKTEWNDKHKLQGRTDIPLSDTGRAMAEHAGREYKDIHFDVCYCSPLVRAKETAEIVLKDRNIPIILDERLIEMSFGVCEGIENSFENPDCPIRVLFHEPEKYTTPVEGAESLEELYARVGEFIREIITPQLKQGKDILIVGHGAMNSSMICQMKELPIERFWSNGIDQCKLMRLC
ncbi:MAG: histidine phosphatase family protein [Lachnospiraceae bacterium]|nr:histidine phosphatase family protein [Lachnospiraceae bacterium]